MVTIKQIADAVGVSSATVSRVLNFDSTLSVSAQTRKSIVETAEALNYATPRNRNRKSDQTRLGQKIALVHFLRPDQELVDPYYVGIRLGIESRCQALKIETVKVYHTDSMPDASLLQNAVNNIVALGPQGALTGPASRGDAALLAYCEDLRRALGAQTALGEPVRVLLDKRAGKATQKRWGWVKKGVPLILEIGGRDAAGEELPPAMERPALRVTPSAPMYRRCSGRLPTPGTTPSSTACVTMRSRSCAGCMSRRRSTAITVATSARSRRRPRAW